MTTSYIHTSSTGEKVRVFSDGEDRWTEVPGHPGRRMMLPYLPNTVHGRYYFDELLKEPSPRRAYRKLHDDFQLPTSRNNYLFAIRRRLAPELLWNIRRNYRAGWQEVLDA